MSTKKCRVARHGLERELRQRQQLRCDDAPGGPAAVGAVTVVRPGMGAVPYFDMPKRFR